MYVCTCTSFTGAKLEKKGVFFFVVIFTILGKDIMEKLRKNMKNA